MELGLGMYLMYVHCTGYVAHGVSDQKTHNAVQHVMCDEQDCEGRNEEERICRAERRLIGWCRYLM